MSRIAYVNGRYLPLPHALVHVEDRGFQFADGVYEVLYRHDGRLIDRDLHLDRLERSLGELRLGAPRLHAFPCPDTPVTLVVTMRRTGPFPRSIDEWQAGAITLPDERWARCDIKSVSLLPNVLARQAAREAGALEAIFVDGSGMVSEGASTSVFIVDADGQVVTRPLSRAILPGCTRAALIARMGEAGVSVLERAFSARDMAEASEVFITAATSFVKPITRLDGALVGDGTPGPVARRLFALMAHHVGATRNHG